MQAAMPACVPSANAPRVLVEWWPKPVIGAARRSWIHDLIERAGGINALANVDAQTHTYAADGAPDDDIDVIVMSWSGVKVDQYRADIVQNGRAHVRTPVTNAHLVSRLLLETK